MSELRIPSRLRIGPHQVRVEYVPGATNDSGERLWGQYHPTRQVIVLDAELRNMPSQRLDTVVHEALHAIANQYALPLGEKSVRRLATALTQFLLDNKLLR